MHMDRAAGTRGCMRGVWGRRRGTQGAHSLPLVQKSLSHVGVQFHIAGRVLDDVSLELALHMGAVQGLLHQLVQASVAVAEVLAG